MFFFGFVRSFVRSEARARKEKKKKKKTRDHYQMQMRSVCLPKAERISRVVGRWEFGRFASERPRMNDDDDDDEQSGH